MPESTATTNIYVQPFLKIEQRQAWTALITNQEIFTPSSLYQPENPAFGVQTDIKLYIEYGIQQLNLADYVPALQTNFYRRRFIFGKTKVAKAYDVDGTYIYDAVYVDVIDELAGAYEQVTLNSKVYYPASIGNMRNALESITLEDGSIILVDNTQMPRFMATTPIIKPTDYITVVVLCYALPGEGGAILSKIRRSKFSFIPFDFDVDRLVIENSLDNSTAKYLMFPHTTITDQVS